MLKAKAADHGDQEGPARTNPTKGRLLPAQECFVKLVFSVSRAAKHTVGDREK